MSWLKGYLPVFSAYSALIFILSLIFYLVADKRLVTDALLYMAPFFFSIGLTGRLIMHLAQKINGKKLALAFLVLSTVRLLLFILLIIFYALLFRDDAYPFMITFFIFYFLFTPFDIISIYRSLKKGNIDNPVS